MVSNRIAVTYKLITQVPAYDMELLIGNIGGYIGLFLGYSILCIPGSVSKVRKWLKLKYNIVGHSIAGNTKINPDMVTPETLGGHIEPADN